MNKPKITEKNSPEYLTVRECQKICRFRGPETIRRAVYRGELPAVRITANRNLIPAVEFWKWFHKNDVRVLKPKSVKMPVRIIKKPKKAQMA